MAYAHTAVLLDEVRDLLAPRPGGVYVDATVGGGGHAAALLERMEGAGRLIGLDRDPAALRAAAERLAPWARQVRLLHGDFAEVARLLAGAGVGQVDGVVFDLGVSSHQLDDAARGFSYRADAPLDMRLDPGEPVTAYHLVNGLSRDELSHLISRYGEERWASRIAWFIVQRRAARGPIETTGELVDLVHDAIPASARRRGGQPARRTFQALRIAVNHEIDSLQAGLRQAVGCLGPGGRIVAVSFHSLEDRIVKEIFRELERGCICPPRVPVCTCGRVPLLRVLTRKPVVPGAAETGANPRAHSAKLRAAERLPSPQVGEVERP
jgi:16S rRNA (cytosine1402-N4)-methyltransferase